MKHLSIYLHRHFLWGIAVFLFSSCDLALQESYEFDDSASIYHPQSPFDITLWEFMNEQADFALMVEAVEFAGMIDLYNGGENNKTVLLLRQDAMESFLEDMGVATVPEIPLETWQNFLNYHVISTRFTQNDLNSQEYTTFQTLVPGDNGRIVVWKWRRYMELQINRNGSPDLPSTAKGQAVYLHNYEFTNGVGHQMRGYVGWAAY
ncbi:MAG: fasciclin domain-containing protein [Bacteroidota bacterium]